MAQMKAHSIFPTPVFECKIDNHKEINLELEKFIHELRDKDMKGLKLSNAGGGWHSPYFKISESDILKIFVKKIFPFIFKIAKDHYAWNCTPEKIRITGMWSVINSKNSYNQRHFHPNCNLSAAYYVKVREKCGNIKFYDPIDQKVMQAPHKKKETSFSAEAMEFTPNEGDLLIFPSYLHHSVEENKSDEERIVISFNVKILDDS